VPLPDDGAGTARRSGPSFDYPTHLIDVWNVGRERLTLRPILPQDQGPLREMLYRTSIATRRARFHEAVDHFAEETLRAMTRLDSSDVLALVVTRCSPLRGETVIADARYVVDVDRAGADFAILVDDAWQRRGVGTRVVNAMLDAAYGEGLGHLRGSVLRSNTAMLSLLRKLQFSFAHDPDDARLVSAQGRSCRAARHEHSEQVPPDLRVDLSRTTTPYQRRST